MYSNAEGKNNSGEIPSCSYGLLQHCISANYQAVAWKRPLQHSQITPSHKNNGWLINMVMQ